MGALQPVEPDVAFPVLEERILERWDVERAFERSVENRDPSRAFTFYDGPPFATGLPHYGHLVASVLKDVVPRYWTMRGCRVERRWGWDCHGVPMETEAQRELGLASVREVDELGVPAFNETCRGLVQRYAKEWRATIRRLGRWVDFDAGYRTMDTDFMESVWWVFRALWDRGLVYEGYRVQPVSPALGTPLSNFEVAQGPQERDPETKKDGHKRIQDPSLTVRFALEDEEASLWAWTTTPWTLPSNLALAVHPELEYVKVRLVDTGEVAYLEPGRLADYQARGRVGETEELERLPGSALVGRPYRPLLPYFADLATASDGSRAAFYVVAADYVDTASGTGIVHQAPAFGEDDFETGKREGLPLVQPLDLSGVFDESVPDLAGQFAKDADKTVIARLKAEQRVVDQDTIVHAYPHCYRTGKPLLYMAISTWFVRVEPMRDALVANNDRVRWVPEYVGRARFGNWLAAARDWNVSRNRFWGTPLPIWRCDEDPGEMVCIGSRAELEERAGLEPGSLQDLHRDKVDGITFPASRTPGGTMRRIPEVFDCWFESGSMPYSQSHYPFENAERVEASLPADYIAEGLDQTRGWFYTLLVLSTALFDRPAYSNVIVNGMVLAEDGEKMSKSKRNFPDPNAVLAKHGADALRLYLIDSPVMNAKDLRFSEAGVEERVRTVMLPFWNAYSFLTRYAAIDGWGPDGTPPDPAVHELDGWILSRLQTLLRTVEERMERYELFRVVPALTGFVDELTNWYIRRSRRRIWRSSVPGEDDLDKLNAFRTLHHVLVTSSRVLAPFLPFVSEEIHAHLAEGEDSVHLQDYPAFDPALCDPALERRMELARLAVALGRGLREKHNVRVRQPLARMTVVGAGEGDLSALRAAAEIIAEELNVKEVTVSEDEAAFVTYSARPNLKLLGPLYGKRLGEIREEIGGLTPADLSRVVAGQPQPSGVVPTLTYDLETLLVDRTSREGTVTATQDGVTVALDLEVSPELRREGLAREVVNRVQKLRKERRLELDDRIGLGLHCADDELSTAIGEHRDWIAQEVLATTVDVGAVPDDAERFEIDGVELLVSIVRRDDRTLRARL